MTAGITVAGLTKVYPGGHRALDGVDLAVAPGEVVALVGRNGSGKSTLFRCLVRLCDPTAGRVHIGDVEVTASGRRELIAIRCGVGIVFQRFHLITRLSAYHNVSLGALGPSGARAWWPALLRSVERDEVMECLDRVGVADVAERRAGTLSGGQQQRVAIARMLMQRPTVVLADEPVASLDPAAGLTVMELLHDIARERGLTTIMAMHHLDYALRFSDRLVGLRDGRVHLDRRTAGAEVTGLGHLYAAST